VSNHFLPKQHLRTADESNAVRKLGQRIVVRDFALHFSKNTLGYARLGMMIPKKYCSLAVDRHHIQRLIREAFRLNQVHFPSIDVVVMLKSQTVECRNERRACIPELFQSLIAQYGAFYSR